MRYLSVKTYFEAIEVGSTDNGIHFCSLRTTPFFLAPNKVKMISNDGNYFINKVTFEMLTNVVTLEYLFISYKK